VAGEVPTLVLHGTADPLFPLEHGQELADDIRAGCHPRTSCISSVE